MCMHTVWLEIKLSKKFDELFYMYMKKQAGCINDNTDDYSV